MSIQMLRTRIKSLRMYSVRQGILKRKAGSLSAYNKKPKEPLADTEDALRIQLAGTEE